MVFLVLEQSAAKDRKWEKRKGREGEEKSGKVFSWAGNKAKP